MNLTYERNGDYRIPNLIPSEQEGTLLTKYGVLRKNYLKNHRRGDLHGTSSERRTADTLPGDTGTGRGEVRGVDTAVVEEPDRDGGTETERSAAVDERDEPDLSAGGGDRSEGTGLSVAELEQYEPPADSPYRQMDLFSLMSEQVEMLRWHRQKCHRTDSFSAR